jgi:aspartate/tyrosine/aromatic aminotransferase
MSFFDTIDTLPEDPIFSQQISFIADIRPKKVNLGIGAYKDATGNSIVLTCVQKAEKLILEENLNKDYLPIAGEKQYILETAKLIFGKDNEKLLDESIFGAQTVGGTAALRIGGEFLAKDKNKVVYLPNMTWANHKLVFQRAGIKSDVYPYYNLETHSLDFKEMCKAIKEMPVGSIIVLHGTSHNPTGINPTLDQWKELSNIIKNARLLPFFDLAYQGFGISLDADAEPIRHFVNEGHSLLAAYTYAKNMGLYGERAGALFAVTNTKSLSKKAGSHIKQIIRSMYSNPPLHAARIVQTVLQNEHLRTEWIHELTNMRERTNEMRKAFVTGLLSKGTDTHFKFLNQEQSGLFAYLSLNETKVHRLRQDFGVYAPDGRINIAGLNSGNMDYVIDSILSL